MRVIAGDNAIRTGDPEPSFGSVPAATSRRLAVDTTGEVVLGRDVQVRGRLVVDGPGRVFVGDGCLVDGGSGADAIHAVHPKLDRVHRPRAPSERVDAFATEDVTIGDRCIVGECSFVTTDFHSADADRWPSGGAVRTGPIVVGSNVWIARTVVTAIRLAGRRRPSEKRSTRSNRRRSAPCERAHRMTSDQHPRWWKSVVTNEHSPTMQRSPIVTSSVANTSTPFR